jgi:hypothetical protein
MRMQVGLKYAGQLPYAMTVQFGSLIIIWSENTTIQVYLKKKFGLSSYFWRKKIKSQETVPESAGEDHDALLRRQHAHLGIDVCVHEVGIGLVLREWIWVDYITYY